MPSSTAAPLAHVVINGKQHMRCALPTPSERSCSVVEAAGPGLRVMDDHGKFEVNCLFYGSMALLGRPRPWVGELEVDGTVVELGQIPGADRSAIVVSRYVERYPTSFEFRIRYMEKQRYPHPDEKELVREIIAFVSETGGPQGIGRTTRDAVHNRMRDLAVYSRVISDHYTFKQLLEDNRDVIEIQSDGQREWVVPKASSNEARELRRDYANRRRDQEVQVVEFLKELLKDEPKSMKEVYQRCCENCPAFRDMLQGSTSMLSRYVRNQPDVFWYQEDPQHTDRVGLAANHPPPPPQSQPQPLGEP